MLIIFDLDDTLYDRSTIRDTAIWHDVCTIIPHTGVLEFLSSFPARKILLTAESMLGLQNAKINVLGIRHYFTAIHICQSLPDKKIFLGSIFKQYPHDDIWVVGDRLDAEIKYGNELGMKTIRIRQGKYKGLVAQDNFEIPHYDVDTFSKIIPILKQPSLQHKS